MAPHAADTALRGRPPLRPFCCALLRFASEVARPPRLAKMAALARVGSIAGRIAVIRPSTLMWVSRLSNSIPARASAARAAAKRCGRRSRQAIQCRPAGRGDDEAVPADQKGREDIPAEATVAPEAAARNSPFMAVDRCGPAGSASPGRRARVD